MKGIPEPEGFPRSIYKLNAPWEVLKIRGAKIALASLYFFLKKEEKYREVVRFIEEEIFFKKLQYIPERGKK